MRFALLPYYRQVVQWNFKLGLCPGILGPGDKVLVRNLSPRGGPQKLRLFWKQAVAEVIQRHENNVIYIIKTISQPEKGLTLHRNMLVPINHILQDQARSARFTKPK